MTAKNRPEENQPPAPGPCCDYPDMLMNAPVGVFVSTPGGRFVYVNEALARIFGYGSPQEMIGAIRDIAAQIYADPRERKQFQQVLRKHGESLNHEACLLRRDGTPFWASYNARAVRDEKGEIVSYQGFLFDITQRKQDEKALRESEEKYRVLVEGLDEALFHMTLPDGTYRYVSPAAIRVLGYSAQSILDNPLLVKEAIHPEFSGYFRENFEKMVKGEVPPVLEYKTIDAQGNERWILQSNKGVFDEKGRITAVEGLCRDITAAKQAEERLQILCDNIPYSFIFQIVVQADGRRRFTHVSAGVARLHGLAPEAVMNDPAVLYDQISAADRGKLAEAEARSSKRMTVLDIDISFLPPGGGRKWAHLRSTPRRMADGSTVWDGIETDITDRKRAEEALSQSESRYRELSIVDDLTQLYNSRHFYSQLRMEINRADRYEQPLTLLMIDLDDFKRFNDTYGHLQGDKVLSRFGRVVKRRLRQTDSAYRYGGEEFTILLPMTTGAKGIVIAERIRTDFKKEPFSQVSGEPVHMTVSTGVGQYRPGEDRKAFVDRVDRLMYQAKRGGKDRVCADS